MFRDNGIAVPAARPSARCARWRTCYGLWPRAGGTGPHGGRRPHACPTLDPAKAATVPEYLGKSAAARSASRCPKARWPATSPRRKEIAARIGYPVALKAQAAGAGAQDRRGRGDRRHRRCRGARRGVGKAARQPTPSTRPDLDARRRAGRADGAARPRDGGRRTARSAWGPVALVGLGGVWIEALKRRAADGRDLTEDQIAAELGRLRARRCSHGIRSRRRPMSPRSPRVVARIAALMRARPGDRRDRHQPAVRLSEGEGAIALDVLIVGRAARAAE